MCATWFAVTFIAGNNCKKKNQTCLDILCRAKSGLYSAVLIVHSDWRPFQLGQTQIFKGQNQSSQFCFYFTVLYTCHSKTGRRVCSEL